MEAPIGTPTESLYINVIPVKSIELIIINLSITFGCSKCREPIITSVHYLDTVDEHISCHISLYHIICIMYIWMFQSITWSGLMYGSVIY